MPDTETATHTLDSALASDQLTVGSKAARLALLKTAGFSVPEGVILPAELLASWRHDSAAPSEVRSAVEQAVRYLGVGALAVRSSADDEDGGTASFAGVYTTVLGVTGVDDLLAAVRTCLNSADAPLIDTYRGARGIRMSVLLQPMLNPDFAGVAFTADPVTGETDAVHVSAVRGLGDALVDGTVTPEEWRVRSGIAEHLPGGAAADLSADEAVAVANIASKVAEHFNEPQDVEWALVDGHVIVLQARPITALPIRPEAELDGLGWEKDVAHYPELVTPYGWSLFGPGLNSAVTAMGSDFGLMLAGLDQVSIGGEIYIRPVPPFGSAEPQGSVPPALLVGLVARIVPAVRKRMNAAKRALRSGLPERTLTRWNDEWREEFEQRTQEMLSEDLASLDDRELLDHLNRARTLLDDGHFAHFQLLIPYTLALYEFFTTCEELLGWTETEAVDLLTGSSPASVSGTRSLGDLRHEIASRPELRAALQAAPADPVTALQAIDKTVADQFQSWLQKHAWRTTNYDPGSPVIAERPGVVSRLLLQEHVRPNDGFVDAETRALGALGSRPQADRDRFNAALANARHAYPVREENVILTDNVPCGILRRWVLEAGRRLVLRGDLARVEDAVFCTADELAASFDGIPEVPLETHVARRRGEQAWVRSHPGPTLVGEPDEMPDVRFLPKHGRRMNEAILWMLRMEFPGEVSQTDSADLAGVPASAGSYTGQVRRVMSEADFGGFLPGEVLVCSTASPAWTILFATAGALVTDGGGPLSHSAIVAREHGLPAVVGTVHGTEQLVDGQTVTVDGTAGTVTILGK